MGIVAFVFVFVVLMVGYSAVRLYLVFRLTNLPGLLYWIAQIMLVAVMYIAAMKITIIKNSVLTGIVQFIGTLEFIILLYSSIIFILRDVLYGILRLINRIANGAGGKGAIASFAGKMYSPVFTVVLLAVLILVSVYGYINMGIMREKTYDIKIDKRADTESLSMAMISDLHLGTGIRLPDLHSMVDKINDMNCDAVLIVGDIADNNTPENAYDVMEEEFSRLNAGQGVYFAFGNHDGSGGRRLTAALKNAGVIILEDESVEIFGVSLLGLKDSRRNGAECSILDSADVSKPIIVMKHQPVGLKNMEKADVVLSGHTHGEQFPLCYFLNIMNNDNNYGMKQYGSMLSIVSSGIGGWGFRFKFPSNSEIVRLNFSFSN